MLEKDCLAHSRLNCHLPWQLGLRLSDDIEESYYPQPHSLNLQIPLITVTIFIKGAVKGL